MKHNKVMQLMRGTTKMSPTDGLDKEKTLKGKPNVLAETDHMPMYPRQRAQLSSDSDKTRGSSSKEKEPPKSPIIPVPLSPKRNGLSPREAFEPEQKEDEVRKLQMELKQQLQVGNSNAPGKERIQAGALRQMNRPKYSCSACGAIFHIKSLLGAHRRTHEDEFKMRLRERRQREKQNLNTNLTSNKSENKQCRYCDRIFDLERALRIHQMCHCTKITPAQRRKLGFTDLAHEKKNTPLPQFQRSHKGHLLALHQAVPDPNMPYVALGPAAIRMIEQEKYELQQQLMRAKRRSAQPYTIRVAEPMGRWR